jgi:hypothetical protein
VDLCGLARGAVDPALTTPAGQSGEAIPWSQIGAKAGADYRGDGLAIIGTESGAKLRSVFQKLEGEATPEGLWLTSTVPDVVSERFRVVATAVGRERSIDVPSASAAIAAVKAGHKPEVLSAQGAVTVDGSIVRFTRSGLVEEYSVSMDGVRQDFVVSERPSGDGELRVALAVSGARVEAAAFGARLVLEGSERRIAYSRLHVTDATGRELAARMEVASVGDEVTRLKSEGETTHGKEPDQSLLTSSPTEKWLAILVNDTDAVYPIRIDPTFSDENWIGMGGLPGADGFVFAAVADGMGNLYIGGVFTVVGETIANRIAKWDGSSWSALGAGMNSSVEALAVSGSDLYAGGAFTMAGGINANRIAKWNGSEWSALGTGMNSSVNSLAVSGSDLYAGGFFTTAGGSTANRIAKWNGSSWSALGSGLNNSAGLNNVTVRALAVSGSDLYAGGDFDMAGGVLAFRIAKWNGSNWSALGSGMNNVVNALAVSGSDLYVGGDFTTAGGNSANYIAKWNGSSWSALGSGMNNSVLALAVSGSDLYAGGVFFATAGGITVNRIAKWNGSAWSALSSGMNSTVRVLAVAGSGLYAGGFFTTAGGNSANYIAKWNGSSWSALGSGMNNPVNALAVSGSDLYVGGSFTTAGGITVNRIARWNGTTWSALGSGMNNSVNALAVSGSDLYAGGAFTMAGGAPASFIAKWNGTAWSALGSGMNNSVNALAVSGNDVYAGGWFTTAGGSAANRIAKWNGSTWSALGSGLNSSVGFNIPVWALAVSGSDLYAGGDFDMAGGVLASRIAKWDGSSWSALGSGMNGSVLALAVSGGDLYAGGLFNSAGGTSGLNRIAKWNGSTWSPLGSGMNQRVTALVILGSDLYAGGWFTTAGGSTANRIAQWNGSTWSALGSGMNNSVNGLVVSGSDLYAGGSFTTAGGKVSPYLARADISANTAPTDILLSNSSIAENEPVGATVGNFSAVDPDEGDSHAFTLVAGAGDDDNAAFVIDGAVLKTAAVFDYETKNSCSVRVRATDAGGLSFEKSFVIQIADVNEAPFVANPLGDLAGTYGHAFSATFPADTFADPDIGQTLSYTASGLPPGVGFDGPTRTFSGAPTTVGNFTVTVTATDDGVPVLDASDSFELTVSPAPLSVTANNAARAYGDANPVFTGALTGVVNSDNITAGYTTTATATSPVGPYPISPVLNDPDGRLANYTVAANNGTLLVTARPLNIAANAQSKVYGTTDPTLTYTADALVAGDSFTGGLVRTAGENVGLYAISQGTLTAGANYTIAFTGAELEITPLGINVAADSQSKVYGTTDPTLTYTADALVAGDNFTGGLVRTAGENVALYAISQGTLSAGPNYTIAFIGADLEITPASLVVSADNAGRAYGEANPAFTGSLTGVVGGDDITADYDTTATALSPVGTYSIVPVLNDLDGKLANYAITSNNGTLTVNPAIASVAANAKAKTYGNANPALDAVVTGEVPGGDPIAYTLATTATQFSLVGDYPIEVTLGSNPNYSITATDGTLTIIPADLTVAIHDPASGQLNRITDAIVLNGSFTLTGVAGDYSAYWTFSSATLEPYSIWATINGTDITDSVQFTEPGVYLIQLTVMDPSEVGATTKTVNDDLPAYVVIYDPEGGFVTGGGWIWSPPGAFHPGLEEFAGVTGRASFGFVSRYKKGASVPTGNTEFQFQAGNLNFKSSLYEWLVVSGARAQYKGWGTINGAGEYGFMLTAIDGQVSGGGGQDRFRIKIWDAVSETIIYDNQAGTDDNAGLQASTIIGGGSVVIHTPAGKK